MRRSTSNCHSEAKDSPRTYSQPASPPPLGSVSAVLDEHLGRTVSLYTGRVASVRKGALEIDVPIIPGESGGPVFDVSTGQVIGIAESRFDEERAIGFATPIDAATRFLASHPRVQATRR
ncbi:MAG TPA: S1C family serine protease [Candidatus Elarobacter sp.]